MEPKDLLTLVLVAPLVGAFWNGLAGRAMPKRAAGLVACGCMAVAFLAACFVVKNLAGIRESAGSAGAWAGAAFDAKVFSWVDFPGLRIGLDLYADPLSGVMILVVTGVGFLIHVYSLGYMGHDEGQVRYFCYLNLFAFFMLLLVLGKNLVMMFAGWEGVGLCSYLLIGFWFTDPAKAAAGRKAFVVNRIGDVGFMGGILLLFVTLGQQSDGKIWSFDIPVLREHAQLLTQAHVRWLGLVPAVAAGLLFIGAVGKSAQIPLYVWLPDAMAGPTPVSALIHAATMVTAGVYMVARMGFLYALAPDAGLVVAWTGVLTAVFAATIALAQTDLKKVLAYSTVSQLGYMFVGAGLGLYSAAIFHLVTHAFFKALLFLGAGSVIHALGGEQDIRKMGGLAKPLRWTCITFVIGALALAGLPPLSGFFSKEAILGAALHAPQGGPVMWALALAGAALTAFYSMRPVCLTFFGTYRGPAPAESSGHGGADDAHAAAGHGHGAGTPHESPGVMVIPLIILAVLAALGGMLSIPELVGGRESLKHWLAPSFTDVKWTAVSHGTEWGLVALAVGIVLLSLMASYWSYGLKKAVPGDVETTAKGMHRWLLEKYRVDEFYEWLVVNPFKRFAHALHDWSDRFLIDGLLVNGSAFAARVTSFLGSAMHTGRVQNSLVWMAVGLLILIWTLVL